MKTEKGILMWQAAHWMADPVYMSYEDSSKYFQMIIQNNATRPTGKVCSGVLVVVLSANMNFSINWVGRRQLPTSVLFPSV